MSTQLLDPSLILTVHTSPKKTQASDPAVTAVREETEEGKKVARAGGKKFLCVFRRRPDAEVLAGTPWPRWEESGGGGEEED